MADKEIPDMTSGGAAASGDLVHVVRGGNSRKATLGDAAGKSVGTGAGSVAAGDDSRILAALADPMTTRGDIIYRGASAPQRLAKGTVGQMLEMGANDPQWAAAAGMKLLAFGTVSAATSLDIPLTSYSAYRGFRFDLTNFIPATDAVELWARLSTNGGSSYDGASGNYQYASIFGNTTGSATSNSASAAQIVAASNVGNAATRGVTASFELLGPSNAAVATKLGYSSRFIDSAGRPSYWYGHGFRDTAQDTDAIQFRFSSGNIGSGSYAVYGLA